MKLLFPTKEEIDKIRQLQGQIASLNGEEADEFEASVREAFEEIFGLRIHEANENFVKDWVVFILCKTMLNS